MESEVVTRQFLAQVLEELERHMTQHFESTIANAQAKTLYWMVGTFLTATVLVGMSVGIHIIVLRSQL